MQIYFFFFALRIKMTPSTGYMKCHHIHISYIIITRPIITVHHKV